MVEQAIDQRSKGESSNESLVEGGILSIGGTTFSTLGKVALAVGMTGLLMYLFVTAEIFIGIGALYTGISVVAAGLVSMAMGNRLSNGFWFEGLMSA
ncbi:hypothetical protein [Halobacteriovorax sp. JY17]|uniref:hypothetical protein n=1 Tax=Halobacteriovorax sp. JY17 TaxID=2014617 RepID=UPI000C401D89|nr:hypothetical protein [Halobacteriovorax sp. JY17]PIK15095.1 MAG: hypothetical protein CES88_12235 [Halobacteriovorax sp. JY17]